MVTVPVPITGGVRAKLTKIPASAGGSVNIRETPNGRDIGDRNLQLSEEVTYYPEVASTDGWVYVVCDDGAKGWVSLQNGNVQFTEIQVPVPNPTPAPEFPDNITEADNLRLIFKSIEVAADQLKASATQAQEWLEGWMDRAGDTD